jgi:3-phenylpropionate/trans-cinnamate dioxygenase ferredoxin subunit
VDHALDGQVEPLSEETPEYFAVPMPTFNEPDRLLGSVTVDGWAVAVASVDGVVYAFADLCTHQACRLSDGDLRGHLVVCPCHDSAFDVRTGAVHGGPATQPVETYPCRVEGDALELLIED